MPGMIDEELQTPTEAPAAEPESGGAPTEPTPAEAAEAPAPEGQQASDVVDAAAAKGNPDELVTPQAMTNHMHLPAHMQPQLQRIVTAGMKVMFNPKTHKLMLKELDKPDPIPQKLGLGVAGLLALLYKQSNSALPPQLMIPAGMVLICHAAQFMEKAGDDLTNEDIGGACDVMVETMLKTFGVEPAKVLAQLGGKAKPAAAPAPEQPAPEPEVEKPAPAQGLIEEEVA